MYCCTRTGPKWNSGVSTKLISQPCHCVFPVFPFFFTWIPSLFRVILKRNQRGPFGFFHSPERGIAPPPFRPGDFTLKRLRLGKVNGATHKPSYVFRSGWNVILDMTGGETFSQVAVHVGQFCLYESFADGTNCREGAVSDSYVFRSARTFAVAMIGTTVRTPHRSFPNVISVFIALLSLRFRWLEMPRMRARARREAINDAVANSLSAKPDDHKQWHAGRLGIWQRGS